MNMLKSCRKDLSKKDQKIMNIVREIIALATENESLRGTLARSGIEVPARPEPPPIINLMTILHRRDDARHEIGMGRSLDDSRIQQLVDDLDTVIDAYLKMFAHDDTPDDEPES